MSSPPTSDLTDERRAAFNKVAVYFAGFLTASDLLDESEHPQFSEAYFLSREISDDDRLKKEALDAMLENRRSIFCRHFLEALERQPWNWKNPELFYSDYHPPAIVWGARESTRKELRIPSVEQSPVGPFKTGVKITDDNRVVVSTSGIGFKEYEL